MKFTKAAVYATLFGLATGHPGLNKTSSDPCPFLDNSRHDQLQERRGLGYMEPPMRALNTQADGGIPEGGFQAVMDEIELLLTDSQPFFPADFEPPVGPDYSGLFIRLAWHCSGSYRANDGRGGCDGARIRFDPEMSWPDNANLDMALKLLVPIKEKFGSSLSWGDLIILSGTTAIKVNGGPIIGFCGGRVDQADGSESLRLGPSPEQEEIAPCQSIGMQGLCLDVDGTAIGPTTVGLIYVNPGGPVDDPNNPLASADDVRNAMGRMGFNDEEAVALIGGGHAFGKCHGACPDPPCGEGDQQGIGVNTFTSGFDGAWTTNPTTWDNQYFKNLFEYKWVIGVGPGGQMQWAPFDFDTGEPGPDIIMLTSDIAFLEDREYSRISKNYAVDLEGLNEDFGPAWYRLTTQDVGQFDRCIGDMVPDPQPFQFALPPAPSTLPDFIPVREAVESLLAEDSDYSDIFINLSYRCAETFRSTDNRGGCNGARIRFPPESSWPSNEGTDEGLKLLAPIRNQYPSVSFADLIILAGITALERESPGLTLPFCGGRVDASNGIASEDLAPRVYSTAIITITDDAEVKGLTPAEFAALTAREDLGSEFFQDLRSGRGRGRFTDVELALLEPPFDVYVDAFADDEALLLEVFSEGFTKLTTGERFSDFNTLACTGVDTPTTDGNGGSNGDPDCDRGIRSNNGVCCASSCGGCGGRGCRDFPGGADNCCTGQITRNRIFCDTSEAPCIL